MLYSEFMNKSYDLTIEQADNTLFYLEPMWRSILHDNKMNINDISDAKIDWNEVYNVLKLEVEKRNTINSVKPAVLQWMFDIISTQVEPAMLAEETDYVKAVTEFIKTNHDTQKDNEDWKKFTTT